MKKQFASLLLALLLCGSMMAQSNEPVAVAQRQLDAYNKQDVKAFTACFAPDVRLYNKLGDEQPTLQGREALEKRYADLFAKYPQNRCTLIGRMQQAEMVIDHEWITGRETELRIIAIYEVKNGLITRCWFIR